MLGVFALTPAFAQQQEPVPPAVVQKLDPSQLSASVQHTVTPPPGCQSQSIPSTNVCAAKGSEWNPQTLTPQWVYGVTGAPEDLMNLYVHGSLADLTAAIGKAGWLQAVPTPSGAAGNGKYYAEEAVSGALLKLTPKILTENSATLEEAQKAEQDIIAYAPLSTETFCGNPEIANYEKNNTLFDGRQHFRVYDTGQKDAQGCPVWGIAASLDTGTELDIHRPNQVFLNHTIDTDEDHERDLLLQSLSGTGAVKAVSTLNLGPTLSSPDDQAHSVDGKVYDVTLTSTCH